jgi:N utilization substance protein B
MPQSSSRRKTREVLYQTLYGKFFFGENFNEKQFVAAFFGEEITNVLDRAYFDEVFSGILRHDAEITRIIHALAPRFDIATLAPANIIPVFIAIYEMHYLTTPLPERIAINEAVEVAKSFCDDTNRGFINGVLDTFCKRKAEIATIISGPKTT